MKRLALLLTVLASPCCAAELGLSNRLTVGVAGEVYTSPNMSYGSCAAISFDRSDVTINWSICERWASEDPKSLTGGIAAMLLAVRDGTWHPLDISK